MKINGYPSREKLKKKSEIDLLFKKGKWLSAENMRIIYFSSSEKYPIESCKIGVSVSKKFFKKAVEQFTTYKPKTSLDPNWGKGEAQYFINQK